ncbi:hypothetical protein IEQ34_012373 [Dendrobium chrysotoxum]|uniref:NAC domain-containing protein n=1 Tax=Dendrobium chrysotoxum TaxID=161865 RepID=A0AAV7GVI7_DENCH|nr:hypothetical protein IEQ34_012373 [Dendrobium chrysotoxum]
MKKAYFCKRVKTNWVLHEYKLEREVKGSSKVSYRDENEYDDRVSILNLYGYKGRASEGVSKIWVMHEYRLECKLLFQISLG